MAGNKQKKTRETDNNTSLAVAWRCKSRKPAAFRQNNAMHAKTVVSRYRIILINLIYRSRVDISTSIPAAAARYTRGS